MSVSAPDPSSYMPSKRDERLPPFTGWKKACWDQMTDQQKQKYVDSLPKYLGVKFTRKGKLTRPQC